MSSFPPVISDKHGDPSPIGVNLSGGVFGRTRDPAKYVVGRSRFYRPKLWIPPKGPSFEWPNGIEGIRVQGQVGNARHKYIGDNAEVVQVMHRDARTFELNGQFNGMTASANVHELIDCISAVSPIGYWMLYLPPGGASSLVTNEQMVNIDNYDFNHEADDRTDSWNYTITFIRVGIGKKARVINTIPSPKNPATKPKGKEKRVFTIRAGARTLRDVAQVVYHNPARWVEIYKKNVKAVDKLNIPTHIIPTKVLPLGMKLHY